jgi:hypothetical protein
VAAAAKKLNLAARQGMMFSCCSHFANGGEMIRIVSIVAALVGSAAAALAATPQCLSPDDIEAEQAIRYQTELMVLSDTCGAQTYTHFARRNRDALVDYQHQVIERFRRSGTPHAEARFDSYMTKLANEVSLRAGRQPLAAMCQEAVPFLAKADQLGRDEFRRLIAEQAAQHRSEYRSCRN